MTDTDAGELVLTKLVPPTLPGPFVVRPRLHEMLDAALDERHRMVLLSAPAGAGKSTLLAGWLSERPSPVAWFQAEGSDSDSARFWSYVVAAIGRIDPEIEASVGPRVPSATADGAGLVAALANALSARATPLVVVIDDYHVIDSDQVHSQVERLIELCPPQVTLVLTTRMDPPFRLGRLRVRGQLTEIRAADLRFDRAEAGPLLRSASINTEIVGALVERTEGWAAGLVLAGLSMRSASSGDGFVDGFRGDDQLIVDYLSDELLATVTDEDRQRLLATSVLERLTGPLIDAVTGRGGGGAWLRRTAATNQLLIGLDRSGTWFRYHHLLRDLLLLEAETALADQMADLHRAAADWHRLNGSVHDAIEHYLSAGERATAADLIVEHATALLNGGQLRTVIGYLDRLGDVADTHVGALVVRGWVALITGRFAEAKRCHGTAHQLDVDGADEGLIAALGIMTYIAAGDVAGALGAAAGSTEPTEATQAMALGLALVCAGRFDDARPVLDLALEMAAAEPDHFVATIAPISVATADLETGSPASAERHARAALELADRYSLTEAPQTALAHSIVARTSTDPAEAAQSARRGVELARRAPEFLMLAYALVSAGDVLSVQGDPEGPGLLAEARTVIDRCPDPGFTGVFLARAESRHGIDVAAPKIVGLIEELTDREYAVLRLLPSELSQRDIASELYVSLNTVKSHCRAIYRKLGVTDRKTAVQTARDLDLL